MTEEIDQMQTMLCKRILLKSINALGKASGGPILVFGIHLLALHLFNTYYFFPNFDIPMHFLGGLTIAFFLDRALTSASLLRIIEPCHIVHRRVFVFCGTCIVAISWEYSEILKYLSFWIQEPAGLDDSLEDLFFGAAGAIFFLVDSQFPVGVSVHPESLAGILSRCFRSLVGSDRNLRPTQELVLSECPKIER
jgi:hypothetical protein